MIFLENEIFFINLNKIVQTVRPTNQTNLHQHRQKSPPSKKGFSFTTLHVNKERKEPKRQNQNITYIGSLQR